MSKKILFFCLVFIISALALTVFSPSVLANDYSHIIDLEPGWNLVSATRLVESHTFSAPETLDNFDIYLLDPASPSGWATMADLGQSEFTPLFGYFINNKTGLDQTLTLDYVEGLDPDDRLFSRELISGWNVVGIANPSYALSQYAPSSTDTNNPSDILVSLSACADVVVDMTANASSIASVLISDQWDAKIFSQVNELNDFRETKAYAVFVNEACNYQGWQNDNPINSHGSISINVTGPELDEVKADTDDVVLANLEVLVNGQDVLVDNLQLYLVVGMANSSDNLSNLEIVDTANNIYATTSDPIGINVTHVLNFTNIYLTAGVNYNFSIRGDVPEGATNGQTYQLVANHSSSSARWLPSNAVVTASQVSYNTLAGSVITVATPAVVLAKVTTNNNTVVKDADGVLLYKGKITANSADDLKVSKLRFDSAFSGADFSNDWSELYLYKINSDATETLLDTETSLSVDYVSFFGFTLNISKGESNGVYIVVRGDVKSSPLGTTTKIGFNDISGNHTIKDSDNNVLLASQVTIDSSKGHITTVAIAGSYTMEIDTELAGINSAKNVLAGSMPLIGRLKFTAEKENAIVEDLVMQNLGDATNDTLGRLYLYDNSELFGPPLGSADMAAGLQPKVLFEDVNIVIPTSGDTYIYIAGSLKAIDYSASPSAGSTGEAETTIALRVPATALDYVTKVVGANTGEILNNPFLPIDKIATSTVYGAVMSNITTDFVSATLLNGTAKDIFSFKVTAPNSSNIDSDGGALGIMLDTVTFSIATSGNPSLSLSSFKIERVGGANGEVTASAVLNEQNNTLTVDFFDTYSPSDADRTIRPGDTAEYVIRATIIGSDGSNDTIQVTIESVDSNVAYIHETGNLGTPGADTATIRPLLIGISNVRGGTLSN